MKKIFFLLLGITIISINGCTTKEFNDIQYEIENQIYPKETKTYLKINVGNVLLFPFKTVANLVDTHDKVSPYLNDITKIQAGIYRIKDNKQINQVKIPKNIEKILNDSGWQKFIGVAEKNNCVECYFKEINKNVASIYAIILDKNESMVIITELRGNLNTIIAIIEKAIQEYIPKNIL
jgi:hypothetical protein